ncbi:hypothetical protein ACFSTC_08965 [Nonomuraea ferruginea]
MPNPTVANAGWAGAVSILVLVTVVAVALYWDRAAAVLGRGLDSLVRLIRLRVRPSEAFHRLRADTADVIRTRWPPLTAGMVAFLVLQGGDHGGLPRRHRRLSGPGRVDRGLRAVAGADDRADHAQRGGHHGGGRGGAAHQRVRRAARSRDGRRTAFRLLDLHYRDPVRWPRARGVGASA